MTVFRNAYSVLIRLSQVWFLLLLLSSCDKGPDGNTDPDDPIIPVCNITGSTFNRVEGNRYEGTLSDTVFEYTYTFTDSLLSSIVSQDGNTRFEFMYQDEMVVKRTLLDGQVGLLYYDTFIYNDLNQLIKQERFDSLHVSLFTYQAYYTGTRADWVLQTSSQFPQPRYYSFTYKAGSLSEFTVNGAGHTARSDNGKANPITIQDLILSVRDILPIDFALVSSVHPVNRISSYGIHQPVSSTVYEYHYAPTCYNLPLKELIIRDTVFEFSYYLFHYKIID
jgi:hypothetical protein